MGSYKHNFCLRFSVLSNDAPDAVGAGEMRKEIADVLKDDDEGLLLSVWLEDTEDRRPSASATKRVEVVLKPIEKGGSEYVGTVGGVGDVRVSAMAGEAPGKLVNRQMCKGADKDRC